MKDNLRKFEATENCTDCGSETKKETSPLSCSWCETLEIMSKRIRCFYMVELSTVPLPKPSQQADKRSEQTEEVGRG